MTIDYIFKFEDKQNHIRMNCLERPRATFLDFYQSGALKDERGRWKYAHTDASPFVIYGQIYLLAPPDLDPNNEPYARQHTFVILEDKNNNKTRLCYYDSGRTIIESRDAGLQAIPTIQTTLEFWTAMQMNMMQHEDRTPLELKRALEAIAQTII